MPPDEPSASLRLATLVAHTAEVLRGNSVVTDRGITLDELLVDAEELAADGVDGAGEMVELISTAIHAEDPIAVDELTRSEPLPDPSVSGRHVRRETLGWTETLGWSVR